MFEVRGQVRAARGKLLDPEASLGPRGVMFSYEGLDKLVRKSAIAFSQPATIVDGATFEFLLQLVAGRRADRCSSKSAANRRAPALARTPSRRGGEGAQAHAIARSAWCARAQQRAVVRCVDATLARGSGAAHQRTGNRAVSVRGHPVVLDALRPRCGDHRAADPVARSGHRARRARLPRRAPGAGRVVVPGFGARQDHARDAARRDVGAARTAVRPLLRRRGYDAAVRDARRRVCAAHGRCGASSIPCGPRCLRRRVGSNACATPTAMASSTMRAANPPACRTRAGRTARTRSSMRTGASRKGPISLVEVQGYAYAAFRAMAELAELRRDETGMQVWAGRAARMQAAVEAKFWMEDAGLLRHRDGWRRRVVRGALEQSRSPVVLRIAERVARGGGGRRA